MTCCYIPEDLNLFKYHCKDFMWIVLWDIQLQSVTEPQKSWERHFWNMFHAVKVSYRQVVMTYNCFEIPHMYFGALKVWYLLFGTCSYNLLTQIYYEYKFSIYFFFFFPPKIFSANFTFVAKCISFSNYCESILEIEIEIKKSKVILNDLMADVIWV